MGARPLRRAIQRFIEDPLADFVLGRELTPGATILVDRRDGATGAEDESLVDIRSSKARRRRRREGDGAAGGAGGARGGRRRGVSVRGRREGGLSRWARGLVCVRLRPDVAPPQSITVDRLVADDPGVVAGREHADLAGADVELVRRPSGCESCRRRGTGSAAPRHELGAGDRLDVLRPAPAGLDRVAADLAPPMKRMSALPCGNSRTSSGESKLLWAVCCSRLVHLPPSGDRATTNLLVA